MCLARSAWCKCAAAYTMCVAFSKCFNLAIDFQDTLRHSHMLWLEENVTLTRPVSSSGGGHRATIAAQLTAQKESRIAHNLNGNYQSVGRCAVTRRMQIERKKNLNSNRVAAAAESMRERSQTSDNQIEWHTSNAQSIPIFRNQNPHSNWQLHENPMPSARALMIHKEGPWAVCRDAFHAQTRFWFWVCLVSFWYVIMILLWTCTLN